MGKSAPAAPPPMIYVEQPSASDNNMAMMSMMSEMMAGMAAAQHEAMAGISSMMMNLPAISMPPMPQMPAVIGSDWEAEFAKSGRQATQEVKNELSRRRGIESTVLTSPLLSEEEPNTITSSLLRGS